MAEDGLPGEHHFYITFAPQHSGVDMPDDLRARQGDEMTIVLQHQFENLIISDHGFQVDLAFDGIVQTLRIPFATVLAFFDPSVEFDYAFRQSGADAGRSTHPRPLLHRKTHPGNHLTTMNRTPPMLRSREPVKL